MGIRLGVCYYPEHWPRERWRVDAALMREAGLDTVRLGEFAWGLIEPQEGRFELEWLDAAIEALAERGLSVVLGTPTAAPPAWLTHRYPDVLPVDAAGSVRQPGSRRHYCPTSDVYRHYAERVVTALAKRYGKHSTVLAWQIDNELGCHDTARCYCVRCAYHFHQWLARRYERIEALNAAWGTDFWSQRYGEWEEILPPRGLVSSANPGHWLDWCRFSSDSQVAFLEAQARILRRLAPKQALTHNLMGAFDDLNHAALVEPLDVVGFDNYRPQGGSSVASAKDLDRMRGLKRKGFWVLEQQCGPVNWDPAAGPLAPGEVRLRTFQAIAHGAEMVLFFRWRQALSGAEQLHSGILPHDGLPGRTYHEVQALVRDVSKLPKLIPAQAPVALLHAEENRWALAAQPHHAALAAEGPDAYEDGFYRALAERNVPVDLIPPGQDLKGYRLVVAATQMLVDPPLAERLSAYVRGGGQLVLSVRSGFKDGTNRVPSSGPPGHLLELLGLRVTEYGAGAAFGAIRFEGGGEAPTRAWLERLQLMAYATGESRMDAGEVVARYTEGAFAAEPAIVSRALGAGRVWYVGALGDGPALYRLLMARVLAEAGLPTIETPPQVEVQLRLSEQGPLLFVLNHASTPQRVALPIAGPDLLTGETCAGTLELPAYGVAVFRRAAQGLLPAP